MSIALLVHAGDSNAWAWPHFLRHFAKWWDADCGIPVYFASEEVPVDHPRTINLKIGFRPWGGFIQKALLKIPEDHILFMHSDYFFIDQIDYSLLNTLHNLAHSKDIRILKCCGSWMGFENPMFPPTQENMDGVEMWRYNNKSDYLTSQQESIWEKQTLYDSILPSEQPWSAETNGSNRLKARNPDVRIYAYRGRPPVPYEETIGRGQIRPGAEKYFEGTK
jgi:hypothetical protein